jgi:hypothetical protein
MLQRGIQYTYMTIIYIYIVRERESMIGRYYSFYFYQFDQMMTLPRGFQDEYSVGQDQILRHFLQQSHTKSQQYWFLSSKISLVD